MPDVISADAWRSRLGEFDWIVLTAALTGDTRHMLGATEFARMRSTAWLVNVARGAMVDDVALVDRLKAGRLRGAVLDVFREEPLASSSPLWQLRQVLLTPHVSPVSPGRFWPRQLDLFLENWSRYSRGDSLRNVVDKRAALPSPILF